MVSVGDVKLAEFFCGHKGQPVQITSTKRICARGANIAQNMVKVSAGEARLITTIDSHHLYGMRGSYFVAIPTSALHIGDDVLCESLGNN